MKNMMWHLYYSGTDVVDTNQAWINAHLGKEICAVCENHIANKEEKIELVVDQKIPKNSDMFTTGRVSPSIMSVKLRNLLPEQASDFLQFGSIYLGAGLERLETHVAFAGYDPWVLLFGENPAILHGKIVTDQQIRTCPGCGVKTGFGRGKRYADTNISIIHPLSWTEFGGILITDEIMNSFVGTKLKDVRVEKIEIR